MSPHALSLFSLLHTLFVLSAAQLTAQSTTCSDKLIPTNCLPRLQDRPIDYEPCKNQTCYLFLHEPPFITFSESQFLTSHQRPFPCSSPHTLHSSLSGLAFSWHNFTSSRDNLCIWAGPLSQCSFNELVAFTHFHSDTYKLAITGLLIHTPQRLCHHSAGASIVDDSMVIVGRIQDQNLNQSAQLFRPFLPRTWLVFAAFCFFFLLVALIVAFYSRGKTSFVTAVFVLAGESSNALRLDRRLNEHPLSEHEHRFLTRYGLAITLFRLALVVFVAVFTLFYEVAVVNFLFQQNTGQLGKRVTTLSWQELRNYTVLKDSALETVWSAAVKPLRFAKPGETPAPWETCNTSTECFQMLQQKTVNFVVTFQLTARYLIQQESSCDRVTIFDTNDVLYHFNAGWLYNRRVEASFRKKIDRELVGHRITGETNKLIEQQLGSETCSQSTSSQIGASLIIIPIALFVFPPLLLSFLVILVPINIFRRIRKRGPAAMVTDECLSDDDLSDVLPNDTNTSIISASFDQVGHPSSSLPL